MGCFGEITAKTARPRARRSGNHRVCAIRCLCADPRGGCKAPTPPIEPAAFPRSRARGCDWRAAVFRLPGRTPCGPCEFPEHPGAPPHCRGTK